MCHAPPSQIEFLLTLNRHISHISQLLFTALGRDAVGASAVNVRPSAKPQVENTSTSLCQYMFFGMISRLEINARKYRLENFIH